MALVVRGMFSRLFPKTFAYLKTFVRAKYPGVTELPDVRVIVLTKTWLDSITSRNALGQYVSLFNHINIFLDAHIHYSREALDKLVNNPLLAVRFLDTNSQARSTLVHEYQHMLQVKYRKMLFTPLAVNVPAGALPPTTDRVVTLVQQALQRGPIYGFFVTGFAGLAVGFSLSRLLRYGVGIFSPRMRHALSPSMQYLSSPTEIEARVTELVLNRVNGKTRAESMALSHWYKTEEELKNGVDALKAGIVEQEQALSTLNYDDKAGRKVILTRISLMQEKLWEYERLQKMVPAMNKEAEEIANRIIKQLSAEKVIRLGRVKPSESSRAA